MKICRRTNLDRGSSRKYQYGKHQAILTGSIFLTTTLLSSFTAAQSPQITSGEKTKATEVLVEGRPIDENISEFAIDVAKFGTQVQAISSDEIKTGGFTNFGELAAGLIRGANIGYSPDEGEFTIRIDGGTDRDTLLLIDGVPTFDRGNVLETIWGATSIDPRMIESVEVFRGGQSIYYGGNGGLGVVNVRYKQPEAGSDTTGEVGFYNGSFKTREMYGNVSFPLTDDKKHYLMVFGRSYDTDAHQIFSDSAFVDNVAALGGNQEFPYSYDLSGAKYLWAINDDTEFRLSYQFATVDFHDSFPNSTVYTPNFTEFPIIDANFKTRLNDRLSMEVEAYHIAPKLKNSEVVARVCQIPRVGDLPVELQTIGETTRPEFTDAAAYEAFAEENDLPAGCVTNPGGLVGAAAISSEQGFYVDENGEPYGTINNPFPIGAPMGYVIESVADYGTGVPTKGFGRGTQFKAGYVDYGLNTRFKMDWSENFQTVTGIQNTTYKDDSSPEYGMTDDSVSTTGVYADLRVTADFLAGTNFSVAARQDFNDKFDDQSIWKFGFRQDFLGGFYLRSNGGTSYSNPTLSEIGERSNLVSNPDLKPQQVETYSLGVGVNGGVLGGTYNIEIGFFDTVIDNMFGSAQLEDVCPNFLLPGESLNPNIITPTEFCNYAESRDLRGTSTAYFNTRNKQDIQGVTLDMSLDLNRWQVDFTFTDMESLERNPNYNKRAILEGSGETLDFNAPGHSEFRQSSERPEWSASTLISFTPTDRWVFSLNPKWQGPEWAYEGSVSGLLVDTNGARTNPDLNFGEYFVLNGSIQYLLGDKLQHRFLLRGVNLLDEDYYERAASADKRYSRAGARKEIGNYDPEYYYQYGWNGKPRSFWLQYEYSF